MLHFLAVAALASFPTQQAPQVEVIHSERAPYNTLEELPTRTMSGLKWAQVARDGQYAATLSFGSGRERVLVLNGSPILMVDEATPWDPNQTLYSMGDNLVLDAEGRVTVRAHVGTLGNTEYVVQYENGQWTALMREGWQIRGYPALRFQAARELQASTGRRLAGSFLLNGTNVGEDLVLHDGYKVVAQRGVDAPAGTTAAGNWWEFGRPMVSADGSDLLVLGTVGMPGAETQVLVLNGQTLIESGLPIPGGPFTEPVDRIVSYGLLPQGGWWASGYNEGNGVRWLVRDGVVRYQSGDAIVPGDSRYWVAGVTEFAYAADGQREVLAGLARDAQGNYERVLVLANDRVLFAAGDEIDWDGDGLANDGIEFESFNSLGVPMSFDRMGRLWVAVQMQEPSAGANRMATLIRLTFDGPTLSVDPLIGGQSSVFSVTGGEPQAVAYLGWSLRPGDGKRVQTTFGPVWVQVGPLGLNRGVTPLDANGEGSLVVQVPPSAVGLSLTAQALVQGSQGVTLSAPQVSVIQ